MTSFFDNNMKHIVRTLRNFEHFFGRHFSLQIVTAIFFDLRACQSLGCFFITNGKQITPFAAFFHAVMHSVKAGEVPWKIIAFETIAAAVPF